MIEILFRGKRVENGEWVKGYYYESNISGCYILTPKLKVRKKGGIIVGDSFEVYEVIPETVGQYTGLTANDKKVFEGDIIKVLDEFDHETIYFIDYKDAGFCANQKGVNFSTYLSEFNTGRYSIEIIGNIHDNHE